VTRYSGIELIAETPLTSRLPRVFAHSVVNGATPPDANCRLPDSSASFITAPLANFDQSTLTSTPAAFACFSISFWSSMIISGR